MSEETEQTMSLKFTSAQAIGAVLKVVEFVKEEFDIHEEKPESIANAAVILAAASVCAEKRVGITNPMEVRRAAENIANDILALMEKLQAEAAND